MHFFKKKNPKELGSSKESNTFAPQFGRRAINKPVIGIWCNWQHNRFWSCYSRFEPWYPNNVRAFASGACINIFCLGYGVIGNTTDSGPVILGSSPGIPTVRQSLLKDCFFVFCRFCFVPANFMGQRIFPVGMAIIKNKE